MITPRDRVIRTLNHVAVDRAPRDLWVAAAAESPRGDEVRELLSRYAADIARPDFAWPRVHGGEMHSPGLSFDAWRCGVPRRRQADGEAAAVHPLVDTHALERYRPPFELIDKAPIDRVNRSAATTSRFVLARAESCPMARLRLLRGDEQLERDLQSATPALARMAAMVEEFASREMEMWSNSDVDGVAFADCWLAGTRPGTPIWRDLLAPLYRLCIETLHRRDKFVFFRADSAASADLAELALLGFDAIHICLPPESDFEALANAHRGHFTLWGVHDGDAFAALRPAAIYGSIEKLRKAFDYGRGGLIAQCEWRVNTPFENVAALYDAWLRPLLAHA